MVEPGGAQGYLPPSQVVAAGQSLVNCRITRAKAGTKIRVLEDYTRRKTLTGLLAEVDKARCDELAKRAIYGLEASEQRKLEGQIAKC